MVRVRVTLAAVVVLLAGCGGESSTEATSDADTAAAPVTSVAETATTTSAPSASPVKAATARRDRRGDTKPPELDLVRFSARRVDGKTVLRWTLAAPPKGTLVAATGETPDTIVTAAVKVYEDPSTPGAFDKGVDAYVFDGEQNTQLHGYEIDGRTVTLLVPDDDLGPVTSLKASTERVGRGPADDGPTVEVA